MVGFHQNKRPSVVFPWRSCPSVFLLVDTNRAHRAKTPSERARVPKSLAPSNTFATTVRVWRPKESFLRQGCCRSQYCLPYRL